MPNLQELTEKYIKEYLNTDSELDPKIYRRRKEAAIEIKYFMDWLIEEIKKEDEQCESSP